jgi:cytidyltransferase-like protein
MQGWPVPLSSTTVTFTPRRRPRVLTLGTFDILHAGHVRFLEVCASFGPLTVGVNSDGFVATFKPAPASVQQHRLEVIDALACVEGIRLNDGPGADLIRELQPDLLAVGPDWYGRDYPAQIGMSLNELLGQGTTLAFTGPPREPGLASSALRRIG